MRNLPHLALVLPLTLLLSALPSFTALPCSKDRVIVNWGWAGALTCSSFRYVANFQTPRGDCDLPTDALAVKVRLHSDESEKLFPVSAVRRLGSSDMAHFTIDSLPRFGETVSYQLVWTVTREGMDRERTIRLPVENSQAFNFTFALSSCADEYSDPKVFHQIASYNPLFFLHMGDLHYHNIQVPDLAAFHTGYLSIFSSPSGKALLDMDVPITYMWDDHDYGPDNSDGTAPGKNQALRAYRDIVPHYTLMDDQGRGIDSMGNGPFGAIYQAYTIGRVRFIVTDLRSQRTPNNEPDSRNKTVLGAAQKDWFFRELVESTKDRGIAMIIWCSTMPWLDDERKWGHFGYEQREIVRFLEDNELNSEDTPIIIVSGDAHMLAVDDGRHSPGGLPVLHAAALGRPGSVKGGPYSHGAIPGTGHFAVITVQDSGTRVCVKYSGRNIENKELIKFNSCDPLASSGVEMYIPPPMWVRRWTRFWKKLRRKFSNTVLVSLSVIMVFMVAAFRYLRRQRTVSLEKKTS